MGWIVYTKKKKKDSSDRGMKRATSARTSVPDPEVKKKAWDRYVHNPDKLSLHDISSDMSGFYHRCQRNMLKPYTDLYFQEIKNIFATKEREYAQQFAYSLFPDHPDDDHVFKKSEELLASLTDKDKILRDITLKNLDDLNRAKSVRAFCKS